MAKKPELKRFRLVGIKSISVQKRSGYHGGSAKLARERFLATSTTTTTTTTTV